MSPGSSTHPADAQMSGRRGLYLGDRRTKLRGDEEGDPMFRCFSYEYPDDRLMQVVFLRSAVVSLPSLHVYLSHITLDLYHDILENLPRCKM